MAREFGGKYSPAGKGAAEGPAADPRVVDAAGARANILFIPGIVLAATSLNHGPDMLILGLAGAGILTLAAWLLREGLRAEAAYHLRTVARRPAIPRKLLASLLTGAGIAIAAATGDTGLVGAGLYGLAAAALHLTAFGIDPLRNKRLEGIDEFQQDRVARVVDEAEIYLGAMQDQIAALRDRPLEQQVAQVIATARGMIRTVEADPRDLTGARRFLGVYLMGARDATVKFCDLYRQRRDPSARADYEALLRDLEASFRGATQKMLEGDRSDMNVEIKVLRDRLQREGISSE